MNNAAILSLLLTITATALGSSLVLPLLPLYASDMGASGFELGLIFSSYALARSILLPIVGELADKIGRRAFILWGLLIYTAIAIAFDLSHQVELIILCRLIQGAAAAMVIPVARAYIGDWTPIGREGKVMGHFNMAFYGGLALGPWMGGFLKDLWGISSSFYSMAALSFLGFLLVIFRLPRDRRNPEDTRTRPRVPYLRILRNPKLFAVFLFRFGTVIGTGVNWTFLPLYGHDVLGLSSTKIGILISVTVLMTTLLQPVFGPMADRISRTGMTMLGGLLASVCLLGVPYCQGFCSLLILNLIIGTAFGLYMPPLMAIAVDVGRESGYMTRVMSLLEVAFSLGMVVGPTIAGLVIERWDLSTIFTVGGMVGLTSTAVFVFVAVPRKIKSSAATLDK